MSQSLARLYVHLVFSTKNRRPFLKDPDLRKECHAYLAGACKNLGSPSLIVGGVEDHVHVLCFLGKTESVSVLIRELKRESSQWLKTKGPDLAAFYWQNGFF
jgi:putative transposase